MFDMAANDPPVAPLPPPLQNFVNRNPPEGKVLDPLPRFMLLIPLLSFTAQPTPAAVL
jgi:hypothetical protein